MKKGQDFILSFDEETAMGSSESTCPTASLFVALYLVILAFFIMLNSISTIEKDESREVMDGIKDSFSNSENDYKSHIYTTFNSAGNNISIENYAAKIKNVAKDSVSMLDTKIEQIGNVIKISMPSNHLFVSYSEQVKLEHESFFRNIAAQLESVKEFARFDIRFLIGSHDGPTKHASLAIKRSTEFAKTLITYDVNPASILIGVDKNISPTESAIFFTAREVEEKPQLIKSKAEKQPQLLEGEADE